jgi:hypothetical protein
MPDATTVSELERLEAELARYLDEQRDVLAARMARILVAMAVEAHYASRNRNGRAPGPKRCTICGDLAAPSRTVCHSCRGRLRRQKEKLRRISHGELAAARNGHRGERAREFANGDRVAPAQVVASPS